jgi:glycosyltransferase involved in cell wall biosynthesis
MLGRLLDGSGRTVVYATQSPPAGLPRVVVTLHPATFRPPGSGRTRGWLVPFVAVYRVLFRSVELVRAILRHHVDVVIGCTGGPTEIPAACLAATVTRRPFIAYLWDDPVLQWPPGAVRRFASVAERLWRRRADVIVPNEALARTVAARTGLAPLVIRNPIPAAAFADLGPNSATPEDTQVRSIVYTGSVYGAQADALANVAAALDRMTRHAELRLYTTATEVELTHYGIRGRRVVRRDPVDEDRSLRLQREADVLLLPLAFRSTTPEVVATAAPGKFGEYLASGRPMFVHAPANTWVAQFTSARQAGVVVDQDDVSAVASALDDLLGDPVLQRRLAKEALKAAREFDELVSREKFWTAIDDVAHRRR